MSDGDGIEDLLDQVQGAAEEDRTSLRKVVDALGADSFIPNLMVPALAVVSPLSGVPLFSSLCGITIALVSAQMLARRERIWLPSRLLDKTLDSGKLKNALEKMKRPARWLDKVTKERLRVLVRRPIIWLVQLACLLCGLAMPFLELVPFTSSILGATVCLFAFGMLARDGLFVLAGFLAMAGVGSGAFWFVNGAIH